MTLKSSLHAFIALATVASLATACQEDESEQLARSNKAISFNIVKSWEQDVTRSASLWTPNKAEYMGCDTLVSDDKQDTLYLERTISDLTTESTSVWTRANILTASNLTAFKVSCVKRNTSTSATAYYFQDETASTSGSIYSTSNTYYWLETGKENYDFYAYAPSDFTGVTNPVSPGAPTFTYDATPTTANCDLMVAKQTEPDTYKQPVPLTFDHLLSGIRFKVDNDCADIKISKIEIKGLNWSGTCNYNSSESKWEWSNLATNASQSIAREFSPTPFDTSTDKIIDKLDASSKPTEASFFVVPQTIPAEAKIYLTYTADTGVETTLSAPISGTLEQGKLTTYTLKVEDFDFSVEQEGLHLKLTFTKGASQATSLTPSIKFKDDDVELISSQNFYGTGTTPSYNQLAGTGDTYYYDGSFFIANAVDRYNDKYSSDYCWDSSKSIAENEAVKTQNYTVTMTNKTTGVSHSVDVSFHFDYFEYKSSAYTYSLNYLSDASMKSGNFTMQDVTNKKWRNSGDGKYSDEIIYGIQTMTDLPTSERTIRVYISSKTGVSSISSIYSNDGSRSLTQLVTPLVKSSSGSICFWGSSRLTYVTPDLMEKQGDGLTKLYACFFQCTALTSIDVSKYNFKNVTTFQSMFDSCTNLTTITTESGGKSSTPSTVAKLLQWTFIDCIKLKSLDIGAFVDKDCESLTLCYYTFKGCSALTEIKGIDQLKTPNVTNMWGMFNDCKSLTSLDVSSFNTEKVTTMSSMFSGCSGLKSLTLGSGFKATSATTMSSMFSGCSGLTTLDLSSFVTTSAKTMESMFNGCSALTSLNVSNFNTSNVTTMSFMFNNCKSLTNLNVSSFDTSNVTNMAYMFWTCSSLTSLDVSNFDTSNVTNMNNMFSGCSGLTSITGLNSTTFSTSSVTDMAHMFRACNALTSLDLSNFDTSKVTDMQYMFAYCYALTSLDVRSFNTNNVTSLYMIFSGLNSECKITCTSAFQTWAKVTNSTERYLPTTHQNNDGEPYWNIVTYP